MKKTISFLVVCMVLVSSISFAHDDWIKPMVLGTSEAIIQARQHNITKIKLKTILQTNTDEFNLNHRGDKKLLKAYNQLHKIDLSIVEDAFTFPVGKTIAEKDAIVKAFVLRWEKMLNSTM